jgi:hypothetical protein
MGAHRTRPLVSSNAYGFLRLVLLAHAAIVLQRELTDKAYHAREQHFMVPEDACLIAVTGEF